VETFQEPSAQDPPKAGANGCPVGSSATLSLFWNTRSGFPDKLRWRLPRWSGVCELLPSWVSRSPFSSTGHSVLCGDGLGLVGADEPRYRANCPRMLVRFDSAHTIKSRLSACVTPYLYGHPWLEKPALYYWRAMFVFQDFGVHDWARGCLRPPSLSSWWRSSTCICGDSGLAAPGRGADHSGLRGDYRLRARRLD